MRLLILMVVALVAALGAGGCGRTGSTPEPVNLLRRRSGEIETLRFTCIPEDGERTHREESELRFPDRYRYRLREERDGADRLLAVACRSGSETYRARVATGPSGEVKSVEVESMLNIDSLHELG